mgnify:CR=1 FL=1
MVGRIYHVGLTVSDLDKSIAFYRDILGLKYLGEIMMVGEETDKMFLVSFVQNAIILSLIHI